MTQFFLSVSGVGDIEGRYLEGTQSEVAYLCGAGEEQPFLEDVVGAEAGVFLAETAAEFRIIRHREKKNKRFDYYEKTPAWPLFQRLLEKSFLSMQSLIHFF